MDDPTTVPARWSVEEAEPDDDAPPGRAIAEMEHDCSGGDDGTVVLPDQHFPYTGIPLPASAAGEPLGGTDG